MSKPILFQLPKVDYLNNVCIDISTVECIYVTEQSHLLLQPSKDIQIDYFVCIRMQDKTLYKLPTKTALEANNLQDTLIQEMKEALSG